MTRQAAKTRAQVAYESDTFRRTYQSKRASFVSRDELARPEGEELANVTARSYNLTS